MNAITEKDASTKWCPFGRIAHVNGSTCNSPAHNDPDLMQTCIGSQCMAWRWESSPDGREQAVASRLETERLLSMYGNNPPHPPGVPETWERRRNKDFGWFVWEEPEADWRARWKGFCGLAGGLA